MNTYQNERYILACVLRVGREAMNLAATIQREAFICDMAGAFGLDHSVLWQEMVNIYQHDQNPHYASMVLALSEYANYIMILKTDQSIPDFDPVVFTNCIEHAQQASTLHRLSLAGNKLFSYATDLNTLNRTLDGITDFPGWLVDRLDDIREPVKSRAQTVEHISDMIASVKYNIDASLSRKAANLLAFGMPQMRKELLFPMGKITCVQGLSGSGKSSLVFQVVLGAALQLVANQHPGKILIQSLEMTKEEVTLSLACKIARVDASKLLDNSINQDEATRLKAWLDIVGQLPIYINDTPLTSTAASLQASGIHSPNDPVLLLVSDYNELFTDQNPSNEQRVAEIFRNHFYISRQLGCCVLAISQSTDDSGDNTHIVSADATRYSRAILMAADVLLTVHNYRGLIGTGRKAKQPEGLDEDKVYLFIHKYRGGPTGGRVELEWLPKYTAFVDPQIAGGNHIFVPKLIRDACGVLGLPVPPTAPVLPKVSGGVW